MFSDKQTSYNIWQNKTISYSHFLLFPLFPFPSFQSMSFFFQVLEDKIVQEYRKFRKVRHAASSKQEGGSRFPFYKSVSLCSGIQATKRRSIAVSTCIRNCPTLKVSSWSLRKRTGAAETTQRPFEPVPSDEQHSSKVEQQHICFSDFDPSIQGGKQRVMLGSCSLVFVIAVNFVGCGHGVKSPQLCPGD